KVITLAAAIRSSSGLPADILSLEDRGYVKVGQAADIAVFDAGELMDQATFEEPYRYSKGVECVFVDGEPAIFEGTPTGILAGKPLRHRVPAESASGKVPAAEGK